jgi:hypothetical protein
VTINRQFLRSDTFLTGRVTAVASVLRLFDSDNRSVLRLQASCRGAEEDWREQRNI